MNSQELIAKIRSLQNLETGLYQNLASITPGTNLAYKNDLVKSLNSLTNSKEDLLNILDKRYHVVVNELSNNPSEKSKLQNQVILLQRAEEQLNEQKTIINRDKKLNINNLRLTEINTYYSKQYTAKYKILRMIAVTCLPILVLAILKQRYLLSSRIADSLATLILVGAIFFIIPAILDMYMRDNMVYDQYNFPFDPDNAGNINEDNPHQISEENLLPECVGAECCDASNFMTYDDSTQKCVEGFVSGQSTQKPGFDYNNPSNDALIMLNPNGKYYASP